VIETDKEGESSDLRKKPAAPKTSPHKTTHCNASMGVYIFNTQLLIPTLMADSEDPKSAA